MASRHRNNDVPEEYEVVAAGGVIIRGSLEDLEIALVHRPRYDDWSFPKGKAEPGESAERTAAREVREETGFVCDLGTALPSVTYRDSKGRSKIVHYWVMTVRSGEFVPNEEVDRLDWLSATDAGESLTYDHDVDLLSAMLEMHLGDPGGSEFSR